MKINLFQYLQGLLVFLQMALVNALLPDEIYIQPFSARFKLKMCEVFRKVFKDNESKSLKFLFTEKDKEKQYLQLFIQKILDRYEAESEVWLTFYKMLLVIYTWMHLFFLFNVVFYQFQQLETLEVKILSMIFIFTEFGFITGLINFSTIDTN